MDAREERGLRIAALSKIEKNQLEWKVPPLSREGDKGGRLPNKY